MFAGTKHLIITIMVAMRKFASPVVLSFGDVSKRIKYQRKFCAIVFLSKLELVKSNPIPDQFAGMYV